MGFNDDEDVKGFNFRIKKDFECVSLAMGKHYNELVTCDVVDMKTCNVLLGSPWKRDVDSTYQVEDEPLMMLGSGLNIIKEDFFNDLDGQHSVDENLYECLVETRNGLCAKKSMVCAQRRIWDPGITLLKILKEHLEDKTFNVSDNYEFHFEDMNKGKHSRTSSSKERGNDEDTINELAEEYMEHLEHGKITTN
nr:putative nucleotidyltransferase, ribonuclease H [Tanacetum cinerariifolium]